MKNRNAIYTVILLVLACFGLLPPNAFGVVPAPDGGYPGGNTAEGTNALFSRTSGLYNTAVGLNALYADTTGGRNTAIGVNALRFNMAGVVNTAIGTNSLFRNTGSYNTAIGDSALFSTTTGSFNTATGYAALYSNSGGGGNVANGYQALSSNIGGGSNTAIGTGALNHSTGTLNTALGSFAGGNVTTASNVICIGHLGFNVNDSCFIGNIYGKMAGFGTTVYINSSGQLGTINSSQQFKDDIKPMDKASEVLFALKPVTFRYKKELDPAGIPQFGLVAEDVEKVNPDLVVRDADGKVRTVRYEQINAMLLNEFLKEHRKVEQQSDLFENQTRKIQEQEKTIRELKKEMETVVFCLKEQDSKIQRVSDRLELSKSTRSTAGRICRGGSTPQIVQNR